MLNDARRIRSVHGHPYEIARAVRDLAVRHEDQFAAVARPRGIDRVIEPAVVIAGHVAPAVGQQRTRRGNSPVTHVRDVQEEMASLGRRDKGQAPAVRRPSRLDVDRTTRRERPDDARGEVEDHQLHGPAVVPNERDASAVGRTIRLVIGAAIVSQLFGGRAVRALPPQTALHRVHERRAICGPRNGRGSRRELRQVQLAEVVVVRQIDLLQHGNALRSGDCAERCNAGNDRGDERRPHFQRAGA